MVMLRLYILFHHSVLHPPKKAFTEPLSLILEFYIWTKLFSEHQFLWPDEIHTCIMLLPLGVPFIVCKAIAIQLIQISTQPFIC